MNQLFGDGNRTLCVHDRQISATLNCETSAGDLSYKQSVLTAVMAGIETERTGTLERGSGVRRHCVSAWFITLKFLCVVYSY